MQNSSEHIIFAQVLEDNNLSMTKSRLELFGVLLKSDSPQTIEQLIAKTGRSVHYVTVYRTIDTFMRFGIVKLVPIGFKNRYELSDRFKPHHHHVTCERCGKSIAVHDDRIEQLMRQITAASNMTPTRHHFEAYGVCEVCEQSKNC